MTGELLGTTAGLLFGAQAFGLGSTRFFRLTSHEFLGLGPLALDLGLTTRVFRRARAGFSDSLALSLLLCLGLFFRETLSFQFSLTLRFKLQSFASGRLGHLALGGQFSRAPCLFFGGETTRLGGIRCGRLGFGQVGNRSRNLSFIACLWRRTRRRSSHSRLQIGHQRLQCPIRDQTRLDHARLGSGVERGLQDIDPDEEQQRKE